jgi:hypothetical protein
MKKTSESFMEHKQASKLVMEQIVDYKIDGEDEQRDLILPRHNIWEELKSLQCKIILILYPFIEEVV